MMRSFIFSLMVGTSSILAGCANTLGPHESFATSNIPESTAQIVAGDAARFLHSYLPAGKTTVCISSAKRRDTFGSFFDKALRAEGFGIGITDEVSKPQKRNTLITRHEFAHYKGYGQTMIRQSSERQVTEQPVTSMPPIMCKNIRYLISASADEVFLRIIVGKSEIAKFYQIDSGRIDGGQFSIREARNDR